MSYFGEFRLIKLLAVFNMASEKSKKITNYFLYPFYTLNIGLTEKSYLLCFNYSLKAV